MPVNVTNALSRASRALNDVDGVRWTEATKLDYFNDGLVEIAVQKPTAFSRTVELELVEGTLQTVPEEYSGLIRAVRNVSGSAGATPRVGGRVITPAAQEILNDQFLDWHSAAVVPFARIVQHVVADEFEPRQFYVFPGNDGNGIIEAILSLIPSAIPSPISAATTAPLDQIYFNALVNYVAYRCFGEDAILNGSEAKAAAHYTLFQNALGIRQDIEGVANVNSTNDEG